MADIAAGLDISNSTAPELLRRAESHTEAPTHERRGIVTSIGC